MQQVLYSYFIYTFFFLFPKPFFHDYLFSVRTLPRIPQDVRGSRQLAGRMVRSRPEEPQPRSAGRVISKTFTGWLIYAHGKCAFVNDLIVGIKSEPLPPKKIYIGQRKLYQQGTI